MTKPSDLDRQLTAFLREGPTDLPDPSFDAVRDRTESTRQRAVIGPWRVPDMNKFLALGLGAAAVVVVLLIGSNMFGVFGPAPGAEPSPSVSPSDAASEPTSSPWTGLAAGPYPIAGDDGAIDGGPVSITVEIASPGWVPYADNDYVGKDDDGLDPPESVGAALLGWTFPVGTAFSVYGDPCQWATTIRETPATTPDEMATALAAQAERNATAPVDVTVGGYAGKTITLSAPLAYHQDPDVEREVEFAACDESTFATYGRGSEGLGDEVIRNVQGPGQIDEFWILDVNGSIVIMNATYSPATPASLIDEMRAMVESATFE